MSFKKDHLRYFVTVAEEGQITRAAQKLFIAQPALSQAIAQLESELGLSLFERHARGVRLTAAGEAFLDKARAAVDSEHAVLRTAASLARAAKRTMEVGFVGPPPTMTSPDLFTAFADAEPDAEVTFRDLAFPSGSTRSWLAGVDVAFCHTPDEDEGVLAQPVRVEPRALVLHREHRLAAEKELAVTDALEETFISYHPDVQRRWAGFHSLDDHRGRPPSALTEGSASTSLQMLGLLVQGDAVTTIPFADCQLVCGVLPDTVAMPLRDADPAVVSLVWEADHAHPLVEALVATAQSLSPQSADGRR
ncbi:MAG TPA: LysR family transcriptional regulator [Solirubrobacteraceae bacterium]|jgi:DNA-binding transcriptional LysR family regulator